MTWQILVQFAVLGFGLAAAYVGIAGGLLIVHRASGIINFAQGAMGMWGAYVYAHVRSTGEIVLPIGTVTLDAPPGLGVCLLLGLLSSIFVGAICHYLAFRPVRRAPALAQVVVSIGLLAAFQALAVIRFGPNILAVPEILPGGTISLAGVQVRIDNLLVLLIMLLLASSAAAYLYRTRFGLETQAASVNERAALLMGIRPDHLSLIAIIVATALTTAGITLAGTFTGLTPTTYSLAIVPALAVLLLARMKSFLVVCAGSIALGSFQSLLTLWSSQAWWPTWAQGLEQVVPFVIVVAILFWAGRQLPSRGTLGGLGLPDVEVPRLRVGIAVALLIVAAGLLVMTQGVWRFSLITAMITAILALSYVVITGYVGQISLAQMAFSGAAGFTLSKISPWEVPFPVEIFLASSIACALGILVAVPAFRIRGVQLAVVTVAAAVAIERFVFNNYSFVPLGGNPIEPATFFSLDLAVQQGRQIARLPFAFTVLGVLGVVLLLFVVLAKGETGRVWLAVRANERAAASLGINVRAAKLWAFAISAFLAGIGGSLLGYSRGQLSAESFSLVVGLAVLGSAYIAGITTVGGALIAGLLAPLGPVYLLLVRTWDVGEWYHLLAGAALVLTAILNPSGIAGEFKKLSRRIGNILRRGRDGPSALAETGAGLPQAPAASGFGAGRWPAAHTRDVRSISVGRGNVVDEPGRRGDP